MEEMTKKGRQKFWVKEMEKWKKYRRNFEMMTI